MSDIIYGAPIQPIFFVHIHILFRSWFQDCQLCSLFFLWNFEQKLSCTMLYLTHTLSSSPSFFWKFQVTRLSHFDYVQTEDLEKIGMGKPAARRLLEAVKKKKTAQWRRSLLNKILPVQHSKSATLPKSSDRNLGLGLTCLIQEKEIK